MEAPDCNTTHIEGNEAKRIVAVLLPHVNRFGGNKRHVSDAVRQIEEASTAEQFVDDTFEAGRSLELYTPRSAEPNSTTGLFAIPKPQRLALEMALHEEAERRALEGELAELEKAWRDAEEIAGIADNLTVPDTVSTALDELKAKIR